MGENLQEKTVEEISRSCFNNKGETPPDKFVYKHGYPQSNVDSIPYMDHLVIDMSLLSSSSSALELHKLRLALTQWGCFQAINHGMSSRFLDKVRELSNQFFALPLEDKLRYSRSLDDYDGYGNDAILSNNQTLDWLDRLYLKIYPEDQRKLKYWPENPLEFREVMDEYTGKHKEMYEFLIKAIARCLDLEEECFLDETGCLLEMDARFNFYPPCPVPENVLGVKPHADAVVLTMLLQDKEVEGLQVLKDDQWFRAPIIPDALFINVGDMLEIMSNGMLKSPVHRAVTNSERERISLAVFCYPTFEKEIGPVAKLITSDRPQAYKRIQHYDKVFFENYQLGQRPLQAVKL